MAFTAADFQKGLAEGLRFFAANEGPYLVHCTEGKDRAGFVSALLACLMGGSLDEVVADYMVTYKNYYHLEQGSEQYEAVKSSNIVSILETITGAAKGGDLTKVDLAAAAEKYVKGIGLSDAELAALKANLTKDYTAEPVGQETNTDIPGYTEAPADPTEVTPLPEPEPSPVQSGARSTYTVAAGDCLWNIAYRLYGHGARWTEIYELNKAVIKNPEMIQIGQVLAVPAA